MTTTKKRPWLPSPGLMASMVIVLVMVQPSKAISMMSSGSGQVAYAEQTTAQNLAAPDDVGWTINNLQMEKINTVNMVMVNGRFGDHDFDVASAQVISDHPWCSANIDGYTISSFNFELSKYLEGKGNWTMVINTDFDVMDVSAAVERDVDRWSTSINNIFYSPANRTLRLYLLVPQPQHIAPAWPMRT